MSPRPYRDRMAREFSVPAFVVSVICFPVLLPLRLARKWLRARGELRGVVWSTEILHALAHEIALLLWPPVAAAGAWALYWVSGWGPGGVGGDVRGAVLGWLAAGLVVLAVQGARHGDVSDEGFLPEDSLAPEASPAPDVDGLAPDGSLAPDVDGLAPDGSLAPLTPVVPAHPLRHLAGYGAVFSLYLIVVLTLVLVPVAVILSI